MILKPNKYLRELGIDENYWLFNGTDERYLPDEDGFVVAEHFDLDVTLSLYIYSQLCYFREHFASCGTPHGLTQEKWFDILDSMIEAFKLIIKEDSNFLIYTSEKEASYFSKNKKKKINYGLRMFIKYLNNLWY